MSSDKDVQQAVFEKVFADNIDLAATIKMLHTAQEKKAVKKFVELLINSRGGNATFLLTISAERGAVQFEERKIHKL